MTPLSILNMYITVNRIDVTKINVQNQSNRF